MNETEAFWTGPFGDAYHQRNVGRVEANLAFFKKALARASGIDSVLEFGAGMGENLLAIRQMFSYVRLGAVEIHEGACARLKALGFSVRAASMLEAQGDEPVAELTFTKGVLIHIPPAELGKAYAALYTTSKRYILIAEYYNREPVEVVYRGHEGKLWKRNFAGELMNAYPDLKLVDYGFAWHRDPQPQDDITWFLMEKS